MKILMVEPGTHPREADIPHTLEEMQHVVGGHIEAVYPWGDQVGLVCDEDGLSKNTDWNRYICKDIAIKGTFFVCGLGEEDFTDLSPELIEKYRKLLWNPHLFVRSPKGVRVLDMETGGVVVDIS